MGLIWYYSMLFIGLSIEIVVSGRARGWMAAPFVVKGLCGVRCSEGLDDGFCETRPAGVGENAFAFEKGAAAVKVELDEVVTFWIVASFGVVFYPDEVAGFYVELLTDTGREVFCHVGDGCAFVLGYLCGDNEVFDDFKVARAVAAVKACVGVSHGAFPLV